MSLTAFIPTNNHVDPEPYATVGVMDRMFATSVASRMTVITSALVVDTEPAVSVYTCGLALAPCASANVILVTSNVE